MARTYMSGHYASGSCGEFSAGGRRGVGDTHTRGWNAGVAVEVRAHAGERDRFEVYMTPGSSGAGHRVLLGTVHDTPDGPRWEAAEDRMTEDDDDEDDEPQDPFDPTTDDGTVFHDGLVLPSYGD